MIKDVTEGAHASLLHESHRLPKSVIPLLWLAALKNMLTSIIPFPPDLLPVERREDAS